MLKLNLYSFNKIPPKIVHGAFGAVTRDRRPCRPISRPLSAGIADGTRCVDGVVLTTQAT